MFVANSSLGAMVNVVAAGGSDLKTRATFTTFTCFMGKPSFIDVGMPTSFGTVNPAALLLGTKRNRHQ